VESVTTKAVSATDEAPASRHILSGVFRFVLRVFLLITICLYY